MSQDQLESILDLSCEERYDYFLSQVGEDKEIWILVNGDNQFLKILAEDDGFEYLPVWPQSAFAVEYSKNSRELLPKSISLPEFLEKWVPGLKKDGLEIGVFPGLDKNLWVMEPSELKNEIQEELSNF
jgi:uncharacterized protein DUF2750